MIPTNPQQMLRMLEKLDWTGHVELGQTDMEWLAASIVASFTPNHYVCGMCNNLHEIIIHTQLGPICEDCITAAAEEAEQTREILEET